MFDSLYFITPLSIRLRFAGSGCFDLYFCQLFAQFIFYAFVSFCSTVCRVLCSIFLYLVGVTASSY